MELRHLRYFCAIAEHGSVSGAARSLFVSQSAISEQISDLERQIGVPLLVRGGQKTALTRHGEAFLAEARKVLEAAGRTVEMAQRSMRGEIGALNVGFFNGGTGRLVPAILRDFRARYPDVRVSPVEMISSRQAEALRAGIIDIGFTRPLDPPFDRDLRAELLYPDHLHAVLPRDHPLAPGPVGLRQLAGERFVLAARETSSALFDKIVGACSEAGFSPNIVATGSVWSTVVLLVEAGTGIAILPSNLPETGLRDVTFQPLIDCATSIDLVMAWSPEREQDAILSAFLALAREHRDRLPNVHPR